MDLNKGDIENKQRRRFFFSVPSDYDKPMKEKAGNTIMRPPRASSPKLSRELTRHESLRQRCTDRNTDEILRYVRNLPFERQPTIFQAQQKVPLPAIGQNYLKSSTHDSGFLDRGLDSTDSDEDVCLDDEILYQDPRMINPRMDPFYKNTLTCPRQLTTSNDYDVLSRVLPQSDLRGNNQKGSRQNSFTKHKSKRHNMYSTHTSKHGAINSCNKNATVRHLPPLSYDDTSLPERPSAPSPNRTPPSSESDYIPEEPVDYIDV